jgi:hypothetical protein
LIAVTVFLAEPADSILIVSNSLAAVVPLTANVVVAPPSSFKLIESAVPEAKAFRNVAEVSEPDCAP